MSDAALSNPLAAAGPCPSCGSAIRLVRGAAGRAFHPAGRRGRPRRLRHRLWRRAAVEAGAGGRRRGAGGFVARPGRMADDCGRRRCRAARRNARIGARRDRPQPGRRLASPDRPHRQRTGRGARRSTPAARSTSILAAFPVGMATRTLYDKAEIVLWRRGETTFHVEVWRSFAPHVAASLAEAARGAAEW